MNDSSPGPGKLRGTAVRPRDAASLILLRGEGSGLEVLVGRRPLNVRFMPGVYVFPGGAIDRPDRFAWSVETAGDSLPPRLLPAARAALRETWEEVGVLFGVEAAAAAAPGEAAIEEAYRRQGLLAAMDRLTYVGRAITPPHSFRRFNTRFFLGDGADVHGDPAASDELEDAGWHRLSPELIDAFRDVTRFMLERAIALRSGSAAEAPPLFHWARNARRIGICREGAPRR